jgi:hypothetical protein
MLQRQGNWHTRKLSVCTRKKKLLEGACKGLQISEADGLPGNKKGSGLSVHNPCVSHALFGWISFMIMKTEETDVMTCFQPF